MGTIAGREPPLPEVRLSTMLERLGRRMTPRLVYGLVGIALALLAALAVATYREVEREMTESAKARQLATARLAATTLAERLERMAELTVSLATRVRFAELVAAGQWQAAARILEGVPSQSRFIDRLVIYDASGRLMADVPELPGVRGRVFADRDWYRGVSRDWRPYVSVVYRRAAAPQRHLFAIAAPIGERRAGAPAGILQLQVDLGSFFDWAQAIDRGATGAAYVVDAKGNAAYHSATADLERVAGLSGNPAVRRLLEGASGVALTATQDGERLHAYAPSRQGWGVVVELPAAEVFAARDAQLRRLPGPAPVAPAGAAASPEPRAG
jgi:hypothetical protein